MVTGVTGVAGVVTAGHPGEVRPAAGRAMVIEVDTDRCCGSGMCALVADDLFDQSDRDGTVVVLRPQVPPDREDIARECARNCPCRAISVRYRQAGVE